MYKIFSLKIYNLRWSIISLFVLIPLFVSTPLMTTADEPTPRYDIIGKWYYVNSSGGIGFVYIGGWVEFLANKTYSYNTGTTVTGSGSGTYTWLTPGTVQLSNNGRWDIYRDAFGLYMTQNPGSIRIELSRNPQPAPTTTPTATPIPTSTATPTPASTDSTVSIDIRMEGHFPDQLPHSYTGSVHLSITVIQPQTSLPVSGAQITLLPDNIVLGSTDSTGTLHTSVPISQPSKEEMRIVSIKADLPSSSTLSPSFILYRSHLIGGQGPRLFTSGEEQTYTFDLMKRDLLHNTSLCSGGGTVWLETVCAIKDGLLDVILAYFKVKSDIPRADDVLNESLFQYDIPGVPNVPVAYNFYRQIERNGVGVVYAQSWWSEDSSDFTPSVLTQTPLVIDLASPAALFIQDPQGRVAGFDPITQQLRFNFRAAISDVNDEPYRLVVPNPVPGKYTLQVIGTGTGPYTLSVYRLNEIGQITPKQVLQGQTQVGKVDTFEITAPNPSDGATVIQTVPNIPTSTPPTNPYVPQPTNNLDPAFSKVWMRTDNPVQIGRVSRSWMWGDKLNGFALLLEPYEDTLRLVQYHDKSRMEINNPNGDRSNLFFVTNGLLVKELTSGFMQVGNYKFIKRQPAEVPIAGDPVNPNAPTYASFRNVVSLNNDNRTQDFSGEPVKSAIDKNGNITRLNQPPSLVKQVYYEATLGHNIPDVFWQFINSRGVVFDNGIYQEDVVINWVYAMGYPISEPFWTRVFVGGVEKDVLVQLFERRVLTYTPTNPAGFQVEMGNVGLHYYQWRYGSS